MALLPGMHQARMYAHVHASTRTHGWTGLEHTGAVNLLSTEFAAVSKLSV